MADRVIQRHDTAARWEQFNPILAQGEIGIITDGAKGYKIGDGVTRWKDLPFPANPANVVHTTGDSESAVMSQKATTEKLTELAALVLNYHYYSDGKLSKYDGRVAINGYFRISHEVEAVVRNANNVALTTIIRYYDSKLQYIGTTFLQEASYCTIAAVVNASEEITISDIAGMSLYFNGVRYELINRSIINPPSCFLELRDANREAFAITAIMGANPISAFVDKGVYYTKDTGVRKSGNYNSTPLLPIEQLRDVYVDYDYSSSVACKIAIFDSEKKYIGNTEDTNVIEILNSTPNACYITYSIAKTSIESLVSWFEKLPFKWDGKFPYTYKPYSKEYSASDFEQGGLSSGKPVESNARIRLKESVQLPIGKKVNVSVNSGYVCVIHFMSTDTAYAGEFMTWDNQHEFIAKHPYMRVAVRTKVDDGSALSPSTNVGLVINSFQAIPDEIAGVSSISKSTTRVNAAKIFKRVGCIGDSYTAGYIKITSEGLPNNTYPEYSWVHYMKNLTGEMWDNWGVGGSTAKGWVEGAANLDEVKKVGNKCQAYVIGLMINDQNPSMPYYTPVGSVSDIGTNADTYHAYYYKLIKECVAVNADAKIFCNTCPKIGSSYLAYNQAVRDVVAACKSEGLNVYLCDLASDRYMTEEYYGNSVFVDDYIQGHYSPICYEFMSECFLKVMSDVIMENLKEFQNVFLIDYDKVE